MQLFVRWMLTELDVLQGEMPVWVKRFEVAVLDEEFPGSLALIGAR